ncbi:MAG: Hsp20/alpha crystallin family protein [Candidatus Binatia bacterium]
MRGLVRWNPFQELTSWHRDIDELFNRFFRLFPAEREESDLTSWLPPMEAYEKDGYYIVRLDLPGVNPKDVEVSVENDSLIIRGERKKAEEAQEKGYHYRETASGRFERRLELHKDVDTNKVAARYENGVLEISMPLPAHLVGRKVPIQIEGGKSDQPKAA